jgi:hypothetical protein
MWQPVVGIGIALRRGVVAVRWMVMLFHAVDGANVPPSALAMHLTVVVWVNCSDAVTGPEHARATS